MRRDTTIALTGTSALVAIVLGVTAYANTTSGGMLVGFGVLGLFLMMGLRR